MTATIPEESKLEVLRDLVPWLLKRATTHHSAIAAVEADCVLWAIGKIEENSRRRALAFEAYDNGGYCENCKGSTENAMARALQGKGDDE